jgi:SAM-dependent methyltransferase
VIANRAATTELYTDPVERSGHWDAMYRARSTEELSWHEVAPEVSLRKVRAAVEEGARSVIDIGGGASRLVDHLLQLRLDRITVLDISETALAEAKARLGPAADRVDWIVADLTKVEDVGSFGIWHDRALFHFLTDPADRARYVMLSERAVVPGGAAIVAVFAPDGPERCSGLPVCRYGPEELSQECGPRFELTDSERYAHRTPRGAEQPFIYATFHRVAEDVLSAGT